MQSTNSEYGSLYMVICHITSLLYTHIVSLKLSFEKFVIQFERYGDYIT